MRSCYTILLFAALFAVPELRAGETDTLDGRTDMLKNDRIDRMERLAMGYLYSNKDSAVFYTNKALASSRQIGYAHGIAVALTCQAGLIRVYTNDFVHQEKLAQEALYWFDQTPNKTYRTKAYGELGFALYAQSRFAESIQYLQKAYDYANKDGDCAEAISILSQIGYAYREWGNYEKSFDISRRCVQLAAEMNNTHLLLKEYFSLADLFLLIEDYDAAHKYFWMAHDMTKDSTLSWMTLKYAELLGRQHKFDSAFYYLSRFDTVRMEAGLKRSFLVSKGEYYVFKGEYEAALPYFIQSLYYQRQLTDRNQVMRCLNDLSRTYEKLGRRTEAFRYAHEGLTLARQMDARLFIREGCLTLSTLYDQEGRTDSAYFYYRRYIALKDSLFNDQVKGKFASYGFEQQIKWLQQEKQLQDVCLRQESMTKNFLIAGIVAIALFGFIYVWNIRLKRKNEAHRRRRAENELEIQRLEGERAKAALLQRSKELEIQALRSQMNPHFIFNCLNAINRFILSHETEAASDYLTKFSRLMRMIMNHSRHSLITLTEEVEILELYLDMECLRFKNAFDYKISVDESIDADDVRIPPLLLQPFVENAIWHGLMHKEERGFLSITMQATDDTLTCTIRDNGIGRKQAELFKSKSAEKHKSMGLQITAERMVLLTGTGEPGHFFQIEDLYEPNGKAAGTQVVLTIKINSPAGEPALI